MQKVLLVLYSTSQELCTQFMLCCILLWMGIARFYPYSSGFPSLILLQSLQWCHNEHDFVSNYRCLNCLHKRLFRRKSKKTSKLHVTGLCEGNSPVTAEFSTQKASNTENVIIWWCHHDNCLNAGEATLKNMGKQVRSKSCACVLVAPGGIVIMWQCPSPLRLLMPNY